MAPYSKYAIGFTNEHCDFLSFLILKVKIQFSTQNFKQH